MNRLFPLPLRLEAMAIVCAMAMAAGCTTSYHREKADREMYDLLGEAERSVFGEKTDFSIDTRFSNRLPDEWTPDEIVDERLGETRLELSLQDALSLAIQQSREYQARKENLYFAALEFSRERHEFAPRFFAETEVSLERQGDGERVGRVNSQAGVNQVLASGARIGLTVTNDLLQFFTGDPRRSATSAISINLVQPLLRGAGASIVAENLTQAERDVIYEIRDFSLFQQTFAVDIAAGYYRILQLQDAVRNEYNSYQNLTVARQRADAWAESERLAEFQANQVRQDELRARNRYVLAVERYLNALDGFKIDLGIPVGARLVLDEQPLQDLAEAGLIPVAYDEDQALEIALQSRLDLLNEIDRFEDSQRRVAVASDQLKADLNIFASFSPDNTGDYSDFNFKNYRSSVGLGLNLPLDRLRERNLYRASLIQFERRIRFLSLAIDNLRNDVRESVRSIDQARQTYIIQQRAVELADRRVENATLLFEFGQAEIRDLLEAEAAQLQARNSLTEALIDYHVGRYQLLRNLGILEVDEEGLWIREILARPEASPAQVDDSLIEDLVTPDELFAQ